jgi:hypothetical protein
MDDYDKTKRLAGWAILLSFAIMILSMVVLALAGNLPP